MTFPPVHLTDSEIERVTGCKQRAAQIRWLSEMGWRYQINRSDEIVIARSYADKMLSGEVSKGRVNLAAVL